MLSSTQASTPLSQSEALAEISTLELAQALAQRLSIDPKDWHSYKSDRNAHAAQQAAAALVFLLKDQPKEALPRFNQAVGWLDRSVKMPPCQGH